MYKSEINARGSDGIYNNEDVGESHLSFQNNINEKTMVSVTLSSYESIPLFR